jgi:hypothetical protein
MKPYIKGMAKNARDLYRDPSTAMIPQMNPYTTQGLQLRAQQAMSGNTVAQRATQEAMKTIGGDYLDVRSNPAFSRNINEALGMTAGRFANSGRVGSGAYAGALGDAATGAAANLYNTERDRQMAALQMAPDLARTQYADAAALEDAGRAYDEDAMARFDWPYERLDRFANLIYGSPGAGGQRTRSPIDWTAAVTGVLSPSIGGMGGGGK